MPSESTSTQDFKLSSNAKMNFSTNISQPRGTGSSDVADTTETVPSYPRATLLGLPLELREMIIEEVIFSRPALPEDIPRHDYWDPAKGNDQSPHRAITYDLQSGKAFEPTALPLLLVNREINETTKNMLRLRKPRTGLEIAVIDNRWILPTWIHIPLRSQIIPEMDVNIVFRSTEMALMVPPHATFGPGEVKVDDIWNVICDNLHFGPVPRTDTLEHDMFNLELILSRPRQPSPFRVQHLRINVDTGSSRFRLVPDSEIPGRSLSGPRCLVSYLGSLYTSPPDELPSFQGQNRSWSFEESLNFLVSALCSNHHGEGPLWNSSTWCSPAETVGDLTLTADGASMGTWLLEDTLLPKDHDDQATIDLKRRSAHQRMLNGLGANLLSGSNKKEEDDDEHAAA